MRSLHEIKDQIKMLEQDIDRIDARIIRYEDHLNELVLKYQNACIEKGEKRQILKRAKRTLGKVEKYAI